MRRTVIVLLVSAAWLVQAATPATATPPLRGSWDVSFYGEDTDITGVCGGSPVMLTVSGTLSATLFFDRYGKPLREIDTYPAQTFTYSSPDTGLSIGSAMPGVISIDYADGAAVGSELVLTITGLQYRIAPGVTYTGRMVFAGEVVGRFPPPDDAWPMFEVDWENPISVSGNFYEGGWEGWAPGVCEALGLPL